MQALDFILFQSNSNFSCVLFKQGYVSYVGPVSDEMNIVNISKNICSSRTEFSSFFCKDKYSGRTTVHTDL